MLCYCHLPQHCRCLILVEQGDSLWFLALLFHTTNALLYVLKMEEDRWCLLMKDTGLGITLIFCIGLVILLHQSFAVTKVRYLINLIYMTSCFSIVQYNKMACCVGCLDLLCHFRFPLCGNCCQPRSRGGDSPWSRMRPSAVRTLQTWRLEQCSGEEVRGAVRPAELPRLGGAAPAGGTSQARRSSAGGWTFRQERRLGAGNVWAALILPARGLNCSRLPALDAMRARFRSGRKIARTVGPPAYSVCAPPNRRRVTAERRLGAAPA